MPHNKLAIEKLESSGLGPKEAKALGTKALAPEETEALGLLKVAALKIPYYDVNGKDTKFFRVRYLGKLPGSAGLAEKPQRYAQQKGSTNRVYFPKLTNWKRIIEKGEHIYITEGELKAAAGCKMGLPVLGLGGVYVWRSAKKGLELLPDLEEIKWEGRQVTIVYDSDAAMNPMVLRAQNELAKVLCDRGAVPFIAALPSAKDGGKQGLDDMILAEGIKIVKDCLAEAVPYPQAHALWDMNETVVYARDPGVVIERGSGKLIRPADFTSHSYANRTFMEQTFNKDGEARMVKKPLAKGWLEWPKRAEVSEITYLPDQPQIVDGRWNGWKGWGCEPKKGDNSYWNWLLDFLFRGAPESREWFERWCAYPLQYPGTKMYSAAVLWSKSTGIGKTTVAYALGKIYGTNYIEVKSRDLKGAFNGWARNKQFIYGDEITGGEGRLDADLLKGLITQHELKINEKFLPNFVIPDCVNYLFNSNHSDAFHVDQEDRRYFIHEITGPPAARAMYEAGHKWLHGDGPSALFYHLKTLPLGKFNPREKPPDTQSRADMILAGLGEMALWVRDMLADPASKLRIYGKSAESDLWTASLLMRAYDPDHNKRGGVTGMGRALNAAGCRQVSGSTIPTKTGYQRIFAVRNPVKWEQSTAKEVAAEFDKYFDQDARALW